MSRLILLTISLTLMYSAPIVLGAMSGVISMRSGVDNIGIEGMMTIGAFTGAAVGYFSGNPWLGFFAGGLSGIVLALLHAIVSISFNGNQIISGIAINFIGPGAAIFLSRLLFDGATQTKNVARKMPKLFASLGIDNPTFRSADVDITVFIALLVVLFLWYFLYYTKPGLRIRACGEHPAAADTVGINVTLTRYLCVLASGFLAGLGGASYTLAIISNFTTTVISGQGFIALAAVIFGNWKPIGAAMGCLLFGFAQALIILLAGSAIPSQILAMLPYVLTLFILIFVKKSDPPKALSKPYFKGQA
ncbi:MAG: ABC transporter permease [Bacillota bacterium]|nr:ABC transporter permease [Bacillota bacterium]